jgi:REP element-mobilizing transposase RayT
MATARHLQVDYDSTVFYHCTSRCVRRAFLCGLDPLTNKNYDHRKTWLIERLTVLAEVFAFGIVSYAIMDNHYHLLLKAMPDISKSWSAHEVIERWGRIHKIPTDVQQWYDGESLDSEKQEKVDAYIEKCRLKLGNLSNIMAEINEHIARRANKEDDCKGRFWEGRFSSQALIDDAALLACMTYIELNPIRANKAESLEESDFTSIKQRLEEAEISNFKTTNNNLSKDKVPLLNFKSLVINKKEDLNNDINNKLSYDHEIGIEMDFKSYAHLVHWYGQIVRKDKVGYIPQDVDLMFNEFKINSKHWLKQMKKFGRYSWAVGAKNKMQEWAERIGISHIGKQNQANMIYLN